MKLFVLVRNDASVSMDIDIYKTREKAEKAMAEAVKDIDIEAATENYCRGYDRNGCCVEVFIQEKKVK